MPTPPPIRQAKRNSKFRSTHKLPAALVGLRKHHFQYADTHTPTTTVRLRQRRMLGHPKQLADAMLKISKEKRDSGIRVASALLSAELAAANADATRILRQPRSVFFGKSTVPGEGVRRATVPQQSAAATSAFNRVNDTPMNLNLHSAFDNRSQRMLLSFIR